MELGHRKIAIIRGHPLSSDAQQRWQAICEAAAERGIAIIPELTTELRDDEPTPLSGYGAAREILAHKLYFTALLAYNDISCIGAIRAIRESRLRVPIDVSVMGFDDIREAAYQYPSITTIKQPLREMGELAAHTIVDRLESRQEGPSVIVIQPELVVRESTALVRSLRGAAAFRKRIRLDQNNERSMETPRLS